MKQHPQLLVYKASAGSGKTFTLAVHYIRQLMEDPRAYRKILAVTFTNKATAEMKNRILSQLYGLAQGDSASDGYLKVLQAATGQEETALRHMAAEALQNILHDYSRFRIETIDSFFQSVMRNLARELELGANLSIELNNAEVLDDAVDSLIEKLDRRSPVLAWLMDFIEERIASDKSWKIAREIKSFGQNIFNEQYIEKGAHVRQQLENPAFIPSFRRQLEELRREALEQMKGFAEQFKGTLELNGLSPTDLKSGSRGIGSYFNKLAIGKLSDDICNATVMKCLSSPEEWTTKSSPHRSLLLKLAQNELMPLLETAEKFRPNNLRIVNSCDLILRYLNHLRLLAHIDQEVHLQNQQHGRFLLSDTNALLHSLIQEGDASFVYEKIGTTIDTVMIDEFQDTSRMQWENFRLLLEESLSQKEGSLLVGDIKQSIYRWRNGDWKILAGIGNDRAFRICSCTLDTNWRSEARIVRFNNTLFSAASQILSERYQHEHGESCEELEAAYSDVRQQTAQPTEQGFVRLRFLADSDVHPYVETQLAELADEVRRLVASGIRTSDIAILVRKNRTIPTIADYFEQHTPYRIVSDEAFRLDASLALNTMMDALRYLTQPDDRIALGRLALTYQCDILHRPVDRSRLLLDDLTHYLPAAFLLQQEELRLLPLYELLERLFGLFELQAIEQQDAYLCAFYDAVTQYLTDHSSEPTAFLAYWEEKMGAKTIPSGELEGIRILSIHKSKGLEYHTVLLPFCDWKMENETFNHLIWCTPDGQGESIAPFDELDLVPVNYSSSMAASVFMSSYTEEQLQLWVDNLNLLYVAFTRACKNLIVWGRQSQRNTVSELLEEVLPRMEQELELHHPEPEKEDDEAVSYELGRLCPSKEPTAPTSGNRLTDPGTCVALRIESLQTPVEFRQSNQSAAFLQGDDEETATKHEYIRQGQLLHAVFASIGQASDLTQALARLRFEGVIASGEQEQQVRQLAEWALNHPQVKNWYDGSWTLYNECSILFTDADGQVKTQRPDRVMMKAGQVVVVDFKFGKPQDPYRQQVADYMQLLKDMGYPHVEGYLWYVFRNEIEPVTCS
ncbi:MAG: UvrD-helicase domain-containing protein [Phocaeicola plebeius]|nr:UvrD-helicase domain-containing protein [Phocaeicola plebeius]